MQHPNPLHLAKAAIAARSQSYAPYSQFAVGAALLAQDGTVYTGCNIENAAYSVCICAERTALYKAVSEGAQTFAAIAIAGAPTANTSEQNLPLCPPCGVCRQALSEFCSGDMPVFLVHGNEEYQQHTLSELLPVSFGQKNLEN